MIDLRGTYAARPPAQFVSCGTIYYPSDVPEAYISDGSAWSLIGGAGVEIGYAQITYMFSAGDTTPKDVPGFTTTFVAGERPVELSFSADLANASASAVTTVYLIVDGNVKARPMTKGIFNDVWHTASRTVRISGLTPGSTHSVKVAISTTAGGIARITGDSDNPASLTVRTL